jgi:ribonucleoside-diphosphate reductase alpha chain
MLNVIRKRKGTIVSFVPSKITEAVNKAFIAITGQGNLSESEKVKDLVLEKLSEIYRVENGAIPYVEQVQDLVEQAIMDAGHYEIAKHYILYRHEKALERIKERQNELQQIEEKGAMVITRGGKKEKFNERSLTEFIQKMVKGYEKQVSVDAIVRQTKMEMYDGISSDDLLKSIILSCRGMIETDPAYSYVAARILRYGAVKETGTVIDYKEYSDEKVAKVYTEVFEKSIKEGVEYKIYDKRMLDFDFTKLTKALRPERDSLFKYMGMETILARYVIKNIDNKNRLLELPQIFWMRVAMGLSMDEKNKEEKAIEFYEVMSTFKVCPSTPTLFQAGTNYPQLSSCYLNTVDDTLESLAKVTYNDNAQMSKYSGGIGTDWTYVRAMGSIVKKTRIESNGIIPFLKVSNDVTVAINRSGKRRGAVCAYLETWHADIEEFLDLRKNVGDERRRTHDMNTANWVPDLFMQRVREDSQWTLFSPDETRDLHETYGLEFKKRYENYEKLAAEGKIRIFKTLKAKDLYKKMITMIFETGHPWMTFKDPCNIRSPQDHVGVIHNSNLCTEITLNNSFEETAVCNINHLNIAAHFENGKMDLNKLKETISTSMRMLDNVIDANFYPTIEGKTSNLKHRPVALSLMGFHDALYELGYAFDGEEAKKFSDESMEFISYYAILGSTELARERGAYSTFKGSKWDRGILPVDTLDLLEKERGLKINVSREGKMDWSHVRSEIKKHGMRNSNTMALAPTASTSTIFGVAPTIEPYYKNIYVKSNMSGEFTMMNEYLVTDLKKLGLWDMEMLQEIKMNEGSVQNISRIPTLMREKYKETFDFHYSVFIDLAAARGKWIDQSQSLNLYYRGTSGKEIGDMYMYAWESGLKTTYYLRTLAATSIEKSTTTMSKASVDVTGIKNQVTANNSLENLKKVEVNTVDKIAEVYATPLPLESQSVPTSFTKEAIVEFPKPSSFVTSYKEVSNVKVGNTGAGESTMMVNGKEVKICKILDPECEACQ